MSKRNENRPGYKKTKVGWIPEEWEFVQLKKICQKVTDGTHDTPPRQLNGIPLLTTKNLRSGSLDFETDYLISESDHKLINKRSSVDINDILYGMIGTIGSPVRIDRIVMPFSVKNMAILKFGEDSVKSKWVYYYLISSLFEKFIERQLSGNAQKFIGLGFIRNLKIPLPPLLEQKKIAEILSAWDRAIEITNRLITNYELLKKGLMQQLLTGRMRFPEFGKPVQEKGQLPEGWRGRRLGSFGLFLKGKGITNSEKKESGLPCITYGEIYTKHDFVIRQFFSFIDENTAQKSQRIQRNDILFANSGETLDEIGKCVAYTKDIEAYAGGDIIIFHHKGVNPLYLSYSLNSDLLIRQKRKLGQGYSVVHIYSAGLKTLQVPLPSLEEQSRIEAVLSTCDREIELLKKRQEKLKEQKKGLMQKLLTGEVRVRLQEMKNG
ncbi:MAG: restriction endonuclease subunit S [Syntrophobacterales bacterium]|nr:restriction endonuclease subunit S [Syntrophobacterales bacterium]